MNFLANPCLSCKVIVRIKRIQSAWRVVGAKYVIVIFLHPAPGPAMPQWRLPLLGPGFWTLTLTCFLRHWHLADAPHRPQLFPQSPWQAHWGLLLYFSALPTGPDSPQVLPLLACPCLRTPNTLQQHLFLVMLPLLKMALELLLGICLHRCTRCWAQHKHLTKSALGEWRKNRALLHTKPQYQGLYLWVDLVSLLFLFLTFLNHPKVWCRMLKLHVDPGRKRQWECPNY